MTLPAVSAGTLFSTALVSGAIFIAAPPAMALPDTDKSDTDGDDVNDGAEDDNNTNPLDRNDF